MLRTLSAIPLNRVPMWLRTFLLTATWRLEQRSSSLRLSRTQDLRALRRRLLAMREKDAEAVLGDFDAAERARLRASKTIRDLMLGDYDL